jgi:hypothetical protein
VEGSATDAELVHPDERSTLVHTNHYVCRRMLGYEGDPVYAAQSAVRYDRARALLADSTADGPGAVTPERLRAFLADHATEPPICRHERAGVEGSATVFWCVADVTAGQIHYGLGRPCEPGQECYRF